LKTIVQWQIFFGVLKSVNFVRKKLPEEICNTKRMSLIR